MQHGHIRDVLKGDPVQIGTKYVFRIIARTEARAGAKIFVKGAKACDQGPPHGYVAADELTQEAVVPRRKGETPALRCRTLQSFRGRRPDLGLCTCLR